jgi:5'-nucleotidase
MSVVSRLLSSIPTRRRVFANRTLNLRSLEAVGYDMDYTLVHYDVRAWEERAYSFMQAALEAEGLPVRSLRFDPALVIRGLVIDTELGNLVKPNRFGYVTKALHGTRPLSFERQRTTYGRVMVDLAEPRWVFLNTFFSLSEACMYAQLVDLLDAGKLPPGLGYPDLYLRTRHGLDTTHAEGALKAEIMGDPARFVDEDPEVALALLDQKRAGKKLLLITNSEWGYTRAMMRHAFDAHLPRGMGWRELFDLVIVQARKPDFFSARAPAFEVVDDDGLLRPVVGGLELGRAYLGGHAAQVEACLGASGEDILYVGDHVYGDVHASKSLLRWRTALIVRELESEIDSTAACAADRTELARLMHDKIALEEQQCQLRLALLRSEGRAEGQRDALGGLSRGAVQEELRSLRQRMEELDQRVAPLAQSIAELDNPTWGIPMRSGSDKSLLMRQVERSADVYTSRVANFLHATPFAYLRARATHVPHDEPPAAPSEPSEPIE